MSGCDIIFSYEFLLQHVFHIYAAELDKQSSSMRAKENLVAIEKQRSMEFSKRWAGFRNSFLRRSSYFVYADSYCCLTL